MDIPNAEHTSGSFIKDNGSSTLRFPVDPPIYLRKISFYVATTHTPSHILIACGNTVFANSSTWRFFLIPSLLFLNSSIQNEFKATYFISVWYLATYSEQINRFLCSQHPYPIRYADSFWQHCVC